MEIDLRKLITLLLPISLRRNRLIEILRVLLSPIVSASNYFRSRVPDWNYRIRSNASVLSLEETIRRELDIDVVISELDGKPIDFLVVANGFVDDNRLRAVINENKLAGKSFVFQTGGDTYTARFINHVCETLFTDNLITAHIESTGYIWATSDLPVKSDITVRLITYAGAHSKAFYVSIKENNQESNHINGNIPSGSNYYLVIDSVSIESVSPVSDIFYTYVFSTDKVTW